MDVEIKGARMEEDHMIWFKKIFFSRRRALKQILIDSEFKTDKQEGNRKVTELLPGTKQEAEKCPSKRRR